MLHIHGERDIFLKMCTVCILEKAKTAIELTTFQVLKIEKSMVINLEIRYLFYHFVVHIMDRSKYIQ